MHTESKGYVKVWVVIIGFGEFMSILMYCSIDKILSWMVPSLLNLDPAIALECSLGFIGCSTDSVLDFLGTSSVTVAQKWDLASPLPEALRTVVGTVDSQVNFMAQFGAF